MKKRARDYSERQSTEKSINIALIKARLEAYIYAHADQLCAPADYCINFTGSYKHFILLSAGKQRCTDNGGYSYGNDRHAESGGGQLKPVIAHTGAGNYAGSGELQRGAEAGGR